MAISRIEIVDHIALGKLIVRWAKNAATRPTDMAGMRTALDQIALIPSRITNLTYVQSDLQTMLVRLPNADMVVESEDEMRSKPTLLYPVPSFYADKVCTDGAGMANLDFLYSRIADYTIAQCK